MSGSMLNLLMSVIALIMGLHYVISSEMLQTLGDLGIRIVQNNCCGRDDGDDSKEFRRKLIKNGKEIFLFIAISNGLVMLIFLLFIGYLVFLVFEVFYSPYTIFMCLILLVCAWTHALNNILGDFDKPDNILSAWCRTTNEDEVQKTLKKRVGLLKVSFIGASSFLFVGLVYFLYYNKLQESHLFAFASMIGFVGWYLSWWTRPLTKLFEIKRIVGEACVNNTHIYQ